MNERNVTLPCSHELSVEADLVDCMGWNSEGSRSPINIAALTVKSASVLQLQPLSILRHRHRQDFVDEFAPVLGRGNPDAVYAHVQAVAAAQKQLWKVRWDNHYKEVYWRVVLNGLAT
jgi:hypothetical protein